MKTGLRSLTIRDYAKVIALWEGLPGIGIDPQSDSRPAIAAYLRRNPGMSFVAIEDGKIIGAVLSGHDGRRGYLHHLAVSPACRKKGVGRALVNRCLDVLGRRDIPKCNIFVLRSNRKGQSFWKHIGWNPRPDLVVLQHETRARKSALTKSGRC